ncbi:hypothetical protein HY491_02400 [Candidatus Woesearchaeota archaeon]|nr:hypothetical protein [Candidatus Woesearchaeota archaeon]
MPTWLDVITTELSSIEPGAVAEPESELKQGDIVVGDVPDDLKQFFGLSKRWMMKAEQEEDVATAQRASNPEQTNQHIEEATKLWKKAKTLREIFWISIKDAFSLWGKESIGVRKGWKVVWSEERQERRVIIVRGTISELPTTGQAAPKDVQ